MEATLTFEDLVAHLERTLGLGRPAAARVIEEVLAYFHETVDEFVVRRHGELRAESQKNDEIFDQVGAEMARRRFAAPPLTARQIRRSSTAEQRRGEANMCGIVGYVGKQ